MHAVSPTVVIGGGGHAGTRIAKALGGEAEVVLIDPAPCPSMSNLNVVGRDGFVHFQQQRLSTSSGSSW